MTRPAADDEMLDRTVPHLTVRTHPAGIMFTKLVLLAAAGAAGTLARFAAGLAVQAVLGNRFPWGTLLINVLGSFLFGCVAAAAAPGPAQRISDQTRLILLTGFLGAFTTFSTFAFETETLLRGGHPLPGAANVGLQVVLGVAAVTAGFALVRPAL